MKFWYLCQLRHNVKWDIYVKWDQALRLFNFVVLNSTEHEISAAQKSEMLKIFRMFLLSNSECVFIMLTILGILTFMSMINGMLNLIGEE